MRINGLLTISTTTFIGTLFFLALARIQYAQEVFSPEQAKALGDAASKSDAAAYVLGVLTIACLGLVTYTLKSKDEIARQNNAELKELSTSIRIQTEAYKSQTDKDQRSIEALRLLAQTQAAMSGKPCALESEILKDYLRGKLHGGEK